MPRFDIDTGEAGIVTVGITADGHAYAEERNRVPVVLSVANIYVIERLQEIEGERRFLRTWQEKAGLTH